MARYLLVQVDKNDRADRLREKLDGVEGLEVIAIFFKPSKFCEDAEHDAEKDWRSQAFGIYCCGVCHRPRVDAIQAPFNLLHDGIPASYRGLHLSIREPYEHPIDRYGQKTIDIKNQMIADTGAKIKRSRARRNRKGRS